VSYFYYLGEINLVDFQKLTTHVHVHDAPCIQRTCIIMLVLDRYDLCIYMYRHVYLNNVTSQPLIYTIHWFKIISYESNSSMVLHSALFPAPCTIDCSTCMYIHVQCWNLNCL